MKGNVITLAEVAANFTMLGIACRRCPRPGRLRVDRLIEQHGAAMGLPELGDVLRATARSARRWRLASSAACFIRSFSASGSKRESHSTKFDARRSARAPA